MRFPVSEKKQRELEERMARLGIRESDIDESFARSSGPGGQHVNKTSSAVQLVHRPTGIQVRCQSERSQAMNRFLARRELVEQIEARLLGKKSEEAREISKRRRQKARRSRRAKAKLVSGKRERAEVKHGRRSIKGDID